MRILFSSIMVLLFGVNFVSAEESEKLQKSDFSLMLRGYCYAGSKIIDKKAAGGFGPSKNLPKSNGKVITNPKKDFYLLALDDDVTTFATKYKGMKVFLINGTWRKQELSASDSRISMIQEAKDKDGVWKPIEYLPSSWCGNSRHRVFLGSKEHWQFTAPRYEGSFDTTLRFSVITSKGKIYSNEFKGSINVEQFTKKQGHKPNNIMDPYLN